MPHAGGHPASLIQILKFSERPWIVPHEVSLGASTLVLGLLSSK
jgi:hypothetical protein